MCFGQVEVRVLDSVFLPHLPLSLPLLIFSTDGCLFLCVGAHGWVVGHRDQLCTVFWCTILGTFRFEYKNEIKNEYDFSNLVHVHRIITCHINLVSRVSFIKVAGKQQERARERERESE